MSSLKIDMTVHIERSPAEVFSAWASAESLASWFAPMAEQLPDVSMDFVIGGQYSIVMPLPDGSVHTTKGMFRVIVPNERIIMTWQCDAFTDPESLVDVTFTPSGGGTDVHLVHQSFESAETCEAHSGGWQACLGQLAVWLAAEE